MPRRRPCGTISALSICLVGLGASAHAQEAAAPVSLQRDGSVQIAGRAARCEKVRTELDPELPNLGISIPGRRLLVLNPTLLRRHPDAVRLFVFYHECGHHHVGGNELRADCWAVEQGVREGWLGQPALTQICASFGGVPETATHPSAVSRCRSLERCFGTRLAATQREQAEKTKTNANAAITTGSIVPRRPRAPAILGEPTLVRDGTLR